MVSPGLLHKFRPFVLTGTSKQASIDGKVLIQEKDQQHPSLLQFLGSVEPQKDEGVLSKQGDGNSLPEGPFWMLLQAQWLPGSVHFQLKAFRWLQFLIGERKNIEKESNLLCHVYIEMSRLNVFGSNTSKLAHKNIGIHQIVSASPLGPWLVESHSVSVVDRCFD